MPDWSTVVTAVTHSFIYSMVFVKCLICQLLMSTEETESAHKELVIQKRQRYPNR